MSCVGYATLLKCVSQCTDDITWERRIPNYQTLLIVCACLPTLKNNDQHVHGVYRTNRRIQRRSEDGRHRLCTVTHNSSVPGLSRQECVSGYTTSSRTRRLKSGAPASATTKPTLLLAHPHLITDITLRSLGLHLLRTWWHRKDLNGHRLADFKQCLLRDGQCHINLVFLRSRTVDTNSKMIRAFILSTNTLLSPYSTMLQE